MINAASITIYIHGTYPPIIKNIFSRFMSSKKHGLVKVQSLSEKNYIHNNFKVLNKADNINFPIEHSYSFGWSGKLSTKERELAGRELYNAIKKLSSEYQKDNITPKITLLTCSHGGNVALNLANFDQNDFEIERLILLACPVQHRTKELIKSKIFKNKYLLYSKSDWLQIADPQGLYNQQAPLFSERKFDASSNLKQVSVQFENKRPWSKKAYLEDAWHIDFIKQKIHEILPQILITLDNTPELQTTCLYNAIIDKKNSTVKVQGINYNE